MSGAPKKFDGEKPPMGLIPLRALEGVAMVMGHGKTKYGAHNYMQNPADKAFNARLLDASLRHISAFARPVHAGGDTSDCLDADSKLPHICHAVASLLMIIEREMEHQEQSKPKGLPYV